MPAYLDWIANLGHDTYSYPWWITKQQLACSCRAAPIPSRAICTSDGAQVDWRADVLRGDGSLTFCSSKAWLLEHMPEFDLHYLPGSVTVNATSMLEDVVAFALMADRAAPFSATIPLATKLAYLLPYASYHESSALRLRRPLARTPTPSPPRCGPASSSCPSASPALPCTLHGAACSLSARSGAACYDRVRAQGRTGGRSFTPSSFRSWRTRRPSRRRSVGWYALRRGLGRRTAIRALPLPHPPAARARALCAVGTQCVPTVDRALLAIVPAPAGAGARCRGGLVSYRVVVLHRAARRLALRVYSVRPPQTFPEPPSPPQRPV